MLNEKITLALININIVGVHVGEILEAHDLLALRDSPTVVAEHTLCEAVFRAESQLYTELVQHIDGQLQGLADARADAMDRAAELNNLLTNVRNAINAHLGQGQVPNGHM